MMKLSMLGMVAGAAAASFAGERDLSDYTFQSYQKEFNKNYISSSEISQREVNFEANMKKITEHNKNPDKTWFATVNQFTDMTAEEFKSTGHGHRPESMDALPKADVRDLRLNDPLPDAVDWRTIDGVVTPVKDQGSCGSCWAFSATETLESAFAIATGKAAPILSPQQLVSCAPNPLHCGGTGGCEGSTQPLGFNYTMTAGITTEANYKYVARTGTCDPSKIKPVAQNDGFVQLKVNDYDALMAAVANVGPVAISVAASAYGWQVYGGGVFSGNCGFDMDHAIQLVGYGTDKGKMYWNVRNSWGGSWGEGGYMRIQRFGGAAGADEPCGVDSTPGDGDACAGDTTPRTYCGLCGILSSSSYPTGLKAV